MKIIDELNLCALSQGYESKWGEPDTQFLDLETWLRLKEIAREVQNGF